MEIFNSSYENNVSSVSEKLRPQDNYDIIAKQIEIGSKKATLFCITGFIKDEMFDMTMQYLTKITKGEMDKAIDADSFLRHFTTYVSSVAEEDSDIFITAILSGAIGILIEGYRKGIIIDCRSYPARNVQEPESDKVLRGSHDAPLHWNEKAAFARSGKSRFEHRLCT